MLGAGNGDEVVTGVLGGGRKEIRLCGGVFGERDREG